MSTITDLLKAVDGLLDTCEAVIETEGGVQSLAELEEWKGKVAALHAEAQEPSFLMHFTTSNRAMRSAEAVADTLEVVSGLAAEGFTSGPIADANGNTVGSWGVEIPYESED